MSRRFALLLAACLVAAHLTGAVARFVRLAEIAPLLAHVGDAVPAASRASERDWATWIEAHDRAIRSRLSQGDLDTVVNWLLFGTTFTREPRVLLATAPPESLESLIARRAHDLAAALASPGTDERRLFARRLLHEHGVDVDTAADRDSAQRYLETEVARVLAEWQRYARELDADRRLGDTSADFAARSKLFRDRGLSLDTSVQPSFALEQALSQLRKAGLLRPGSVTRVAVIGPGLDFSDKNAGYDFYPQQTVQPFALVDSLRRLGLAQPSGIVDLTTFDLSPRVNDHLTRARTRANAGASYVIHLALDASIPWSKGFVEYWQRLGQQIGTSAVEPVPTVLGPSVRGRVLRVRPDVMQHIAPEDLDIVTQRDDAHAFDLVVATNILVYYDTLEQSLALSNITAMLKPGGILLSNNALLELPELGIRSIGYATTVYSERRDDGDHVIFYRKEQ